MMHLFFKLSKSLRCQAVPSIYFNDSLRQLNPRLIELSCTRELFDHLFHIPKKAKLL